MGNDYELRLVDFTEEYAKDVCTWKYDGEYKVYNMPSWNEIYKSGWGMTKEVKRKKEFKAVLDKENKFVGYIRLMEKKDGVWFGVGIKPCFCGQGLGKIFMRFLIDESKMRYPQRKILLEVRDFNIRAMKCYKRAGFSEVDSYVKETPMGIGRFIKMELIDVSEKSI